jgi:hypothetical protein
VTWYPAVDIVDTATATPDPVIAAALACFPRLAERAAPAAFCCALDLAGMTESPLGAPPEKAISPSAFRPLPRNAFRGRFRLAGFLPATPKNP